METIYLDYEFHKVIRIIQLIFKSVLFKQTLIALYILYVTHRYMKTKCWWHLTIININKNISDLLDSINDA